jgi:UDP-N-acetylmuramate dehydrogenase
MIYKNFSLKRYNTFGLDYKTRTFAEISSEDQLVSLIKETDTSGNYCFILGSGSNILLTKDFDNLIIHSVIEGIQIEEKNTRYVIISSGSGVKWDDLVSWCVNRNYSGLENLSLIPGLVGACPVQNIGAYGVEGSDIIAKVRTVNLADGSVVEFSNNDCRFGYRHSIFKDELKGKYMVTRVYFKLSVTPVYNTKYGALDDEVLRLGGIDLKNIRQAVINIRRSKLPDPAIIGNAGSFFKNPVVENTIGENLKSRYDNMPLYQESSDKKKLAAGWLIEQCGWKGIRIGETGVHEKQALVIVNYGKATGQEILDLSEKIRKSVLEKFGITLEHEVEIL